MGCNSPLSTLAPAGPAAELIAHLWWVMLIGTAVLSALILGLVAWGFKASQRKPIGARFWALAMGIGMPLVILIALVGTGLWMGERMQARAGEDVVEVHAHARQWAWDFSQPGANGELVRTENVLFIPAGKPVNVRITSQDVIHSFWVPRLSGKMDAIPGHSNVLRIQAHQPGNYAGVSAEFSGLGYADMRFTVVAYPSESPPDIQDWLLKHQNIHGAKAEANP